MKEIKKSELVLGTDGSIYHLQLNPGDVSTTILLVGDPDRAKTIADYFDEIIFHQQNREINTYTGIYRNTKLTVLSTGMGTDNIEIVVNELDALFNIDFETKLPKTDKTSLNLVRIGTSGALQTDIPIKESYVVSELSIGIDGLAYFYDDGPNVFNRKLTDAFISYMKWDENLPKPYATAASEYLLKKIAYGLRKGITLTAPGFYAPQGRELRLNVKDKTIIDRASQFSFEGHNITNFEMETSALYLLSAMLGHEAMTVCDIIANRVTNEFNPNYKSSMHKLIKLMLDRLITL